MSSFFSFLCCSSDTRDDADEIKYSQNTASHSPINKEVKSRDDMLLDNGKRKREKREKLDFDDNSINETETIANTNEDQTPTTLPSNRNNGNTNGNNQQLNGSTKNGAATQLDNNNHSDSNEGSSKDHDRTSHVITHDHSYSSSSNDHQELEPPLDAAVAKNNNITNNNNTDNANNSNNNNNNNVAAGAGANDDVIIAQAGPNEDMVDLDVHDLDDESLMDLTRFQEGQYRNPETGWLLGKQEPQFKNKKCLILDLDETLVHSSFKYLRTADFVIPVEIDNQVHHVYVIKRPGVDEFLKKVGQWFEIVVFTASVLKYGDPLLDKLDIHKSVHHRLFRDSCYNYEGNFIKNLSQIGRPLQDSIIIDNSPASYIFHPQHSVPISSWFSDTHDNELVDLLPFLHDLSKQNVDDVSLVLDVMI